MEGLNSRTAYAFGPAIFASEGGSIDILMEINDQNLIERILSGRSRGLSPEIRIDEWDCSICGENYEYCKHIIGEKYGEHTCQIIRKKIEFTGNSIVDEPLDKRCRIEDVLIVQKNGVKKYTWYGYKPNKTANRFKHLQKAFDNGYISEKSLHYLSREFSMKINGVIKFT